MFKQLISFLLASSLGIGNGALPAYGENFDDRSLLSISSIPTKQEEYVAPAEISSVAAIAIDLDSQTILFQKNSDLKLPIASLTKLMTAYIILEEEDPDAIVTISSNAISTEGSEMNLFSGETITIKNLLYGLLIESGNDAAIALAEFNAGSEANFVNKMNKEAENLGLEQSQFSNATGLDYGEGYSTPRDLALLSSYLLQDQTIREIVNKKEAEVTSTTGVIHNLKNTNTILGEMGIKGLKTGKTPAAGECLVTLAESPTGREILIVALGSQSRFLDSKILVDWIYRAYIW